MTIPNGTTVTAGGLVFGAVNNAANSGYAIQSGTLSLGANATITLAGTTSNQITTIWSRVVATDIAITATSGTQTVQFRGNNSITGTISVQATGGATGAGVSFTSAASLSSATLDLRSGVRWGTTGGETYTNNVLLSGTGYGTTYGVIGVGTGAAVLSGTVTMTGDSLFYGNSSGTLTIQKGILETGGSRSLTIANGGSAPGGVTILQGASTYTGTTVIGAGIQTIILDGGDNRLSPQTKLATLSVGYAQKLVLGGTLGGAMRQSLAGLSSSYASLAIVGGASGMSALDVTVASGTNTFAGVLGGTAANENNLSLSKAGAGTLALTGSTTHTGTTSVTAGTLAIGNVNALRNSTLDVGSTVTFAVAGTNTYNIGGLNGATNMAVGPNTLSIGGNNESTTYSGVLSGSSGVGLTKVGTGVLTLGGSNTLSGPFTIGNGAISVATIGNASTANPLGTSGTVNLGTSTTTGMLRYTGSGETTSRVFVLSGTTGAGGGIESNGSGPLSLNLTGTAVTTSGGTKTFTLGGSNTGTNSIGLISDPASPASSTQLIKVGAGRWVLASGSSTFAGGVVVQQGELWVNADTTIDSQGSLGFKGAGYNVTVGSATGSGTVALLLRDGVTVRNRTVNVTGAAGQVVILGGADGSGTATFADSSGGQGAVTINLDRDVTLQAKTGGTVVFSGSWAFDTSGSAKAITIGSAGNAGRVRLDSVLGTTGAINVAAGTLSVNGSTLSASIPSASGVTVASGATLGGSGRITSNIGGDGLIAPGNSPGILQVDGQVIPTGSTSFAFEFTQTGDPTWSNATASLNDVLRLTNAAPFQSPLTATNVVSVYFDVVSLTSGDIFRGGFYSDKTSGQLNFASAIGAPTYAFFVYGSGSGGTNYNGKNYYTLAQYMAANPSVTGITTSVVTVGSANYANGTVTNGQVTQFVVVPEPATLVLAAVGIGLGVWAAARRRSNPSPTARAGRAG